MLTPAFTASQSALTPSNVTLSDTSSGSDAAIATKRAYFQTAMGTYLVVGGVATDWNPFPDTTDTFNILQTDTACAVTVQWLDVNGEVLYELTQEYCFAAYNKQFFYYLVQLQALTPSVLQDANYAANMAAYWMNITGAIQAVEIGADISASQNCLNRATAIKENQNFNF